LILPLVVMSGLVFANREFKNETTKKPPLPPGSRLGFGIMARINGDDYIVKFEPEKSQLEQLHSLKVNDRIIIRSHGVSHAPKYSYPIVSCEYAERDSKVIFKRVPRKGGC
jgi:hypothetical protein